MLRESKSSASIGGWFGGKGVVPRNNTDVEQCRKVSRMSIICNTCYAASSRPPRGDRARNRLACAVAKGPRCSVVCVGNVDSVVLFKVGSGCVLPKCLSESLEEIF